MKSETIFVQRYPEHGYEIRTEKVDPEGEGNNIEMKSAYTKSGAYIGGARDGRFLCEEKGIVPETIDSEHDVCSIGFCDAEQKWYGWSHRAIYGFGIGSRVEKGDCAYTPSSVKELHEDLEKNGEHGETIDDTTVRVAIDRYITDDENDDGIVELLNKPNTEYYTVKTGRGEWTSKNLDDARQMAIDFANDVA